MASSDFFHDIRLNGHRALGMADPVQPTDGANRQWVLARIAELVASSPAALDTLNELAAALGNDANFAATLATQLGSLDARLDQIEANGATDPTAPKIIEQTIGDGSVKNFTITHGLNTRHVLVEVCRAGTPWDSVSAYVTRPTVNQVTIDFGTYTPTNGEFLVTITGKQH